MHTDVYRTRARAYTGNHLKTLKRLYRVSPSLPSPSLTSPRTFSYSPLLASLPVFARLPHFSRPTYNYSPRNWRRRPRRRNLLGLSSRPPSTILLGEITRSRKLLEHGAGNGTPGSFQLACANTKRRQLPGCARVARRR